jgi:hypothetical protein
MIEQQDIILRDEISKLTLELRSAYYKSHVSEPECYDVPYGGKMTESIGAWPEFILKGTFCKRSSKGFCSPCFYSRLPKGNTTRHDYLKMVEKQVTHITDHFKPLIMDSQYGE